MTTLDFKLPDAHGVDPYDALRSPRLPRWVSRSPRLRQAVIQIRKRVPWDLSRLLGIEPFIMAKTLGCHLTAVARVAHVTGAHECGSVEEVVASLDATEGNLGRGAWGYEFDVQTRWAFYPAGSPNLIVTAFVGRALALAGLVCDREDWVARSRESADFALGALSNRPGARPGAFYYTLDTRHLVHNANLLGAALCAAATLSGDSEPYATAALNAARTSLSFQRADGSWPYGDTRALDWVDSFHTAYVLDGLLQVWLVTGDAEVESALERGCAYWASSFFGPNGEPYYYASGRGPYDIHAAATAVDVGARLATWGLVSDELPKRVERWTREHLVDPVTGRTWYRIGALSTDRRNFARWGDAHWALARASMLLLDASMRDPLETRIRGER